MLESNSEGDSEIMNSEGDSEIMNSERNSEDLLNYK